MDVKKEPEDLTTDNNKIFNCKSGHEKYSSNMKNIIPYAQKDAEYFHEENQVEIDHKAVRICPQVVKIKQESKYFNKESQHFKNHFENTTDLKFDKACFKECSLLKDNVISKDEDIEIKCEVDCQWPSSDENNLNNTDCLKADQSCNIDNLINAEYNGPVDMEFSKNQKGNHVLTCLGYEYNKFRENNVTGLITWRCRQNKSSSCKAFIKTNGDSIVGALSLHSHNSCPQKAKANIAMSKMKEDIQVIGATARNVIGKETNGLNEDVLAHLPKKSSIVRNLFRHRKGSNRLPNRKKSDVSSFAEKYGRIILHDSGHGDPDRILAIGDRDLLQALNTDVIYGDSTFDKVTTASCYLYTWHAEVGDCYPPCVYFLLRQKNLQNYSKMFQILKDMLPNLAPQKVLLDFDKVCINSAQLAFPNAEIKACYFCLCQSIERKINSVGLKAEFESDVDVKMLLKSLTSLAFVPSGEVKSVFNSLAFSFPNEENYNEVLTHFFYTYIEGAAGRDPKFPIRLWNQREAACERSPGTFDCCEKFHSALNSLLRCSYPGVGYLLGGLERDLACHKETLEKSRTGCSELKKKKCDDLQEQLAVVVQCYHKQENKLSFLRRIANLH